MPMEALFESFVVTVILEGMPPIVFGTVFAHSRSSWLIFLSTWQDYRFDDPDSNEWEMTAAHEGGLSGTESTKGWGFGAGAGCGGFGSRVRGAGRAIVWGRGNWHVGCIKGWLIGFF